MKRTLQLLAMLLLPTVAVAGPNIAMTPLKVDSNIPADIGKSFDEHLRGLAAEKGGVTTLADVAAAMKKAGVDGPCTTDACAIKLATAAGARFVLTSKVTNSDEIYSIELSVFDTALSVRSKNGEALCELCAADEVNPIITIAFKELDKAFSAAAPTATKPPAAPKIAEGMIPVHVRTTPEGADVRIDGELKGQAPMVVGVKPGTHDVTAAKPGFATAQRKISALDRPVKITFELEAVATPPVASKPKDADAGHSNPVSPDQVGTVVPAPEVPSTSSAGLYGSAWGMMLGGVGLSAVGGWLIDLDGDVTCTDGRGLRECPKVFNTKGLGSTALGLGTALVGVGVGILVTESILLGGVTTEAVVEPTPEGAGAAIKLRGRF